MSTKIQTKKFVITNLASTTSLDEALNFFGFVSSEERQSCTATFSAGNDPSSAAVEIPECMAD